MWAREYEKCLVCNKNNREHQAKGLCVFCYGKKNKNKYKFGGNREKHLISFPICIICNKNTNLVVHHKDENKNNNNLDNFSTLCTACHARVHNILRHKDIIKKHKDIFRF